jgi:VCBS repeat-containing protein
MKVYSKKSKFLSIILLLAIVLQSCSFNPSSDGSCKSLLCDGWWADEYNGEPLMASTGSWTFKEDGTVEHHIGIGGNKENGTWALGITQGSFRNISITIGGATKNATIQDDNHAYLSIDGCTNATGSITLLTHWNDNNKRID